jgi:predicted DNA-binding transcriptional regulator YafY
VAGADGQPRTYRVSRVNRVTVLDEPFERPSQFDLAAFWAESSAAYERDTPRTEIVLRIARERLDRLRGVIGERPYDTIERLDEPDPDGWLRIRVKLDWPNEVTSQVLAVGPDCELLQPAELRPRIAAQAARLAAHYAERPPDDPAAASVGATTVQTAR